MSWSRRGFLGTLLASLGTSTIDRSALLWEPFRPEPVPVDTNAVLTLEQVTDAMLQRIAKDIQGTLAGMRLGEGRMTSPRLGEGLLSHQFHIAAVLPRIIKHDGWTVDAHGEEAARRLIKDIKKAKAKVFAPLTTVGYPGDIEAVTRIHPDAGLALRGMVLANGPVLGVNTPASGESAAVVRFDILCG